MSSSVLQNEYKVILDKLNKTFDTNKTKSYEWRVQQLKGLSRLMTENEAKIEEALAKDLGRCRFEAISLETLGINMEIVEVLKSGNLDEWMKVNYTSLPAMMAPATSEYIYEPYGVVLIISAFNYPIALTLSPLLGAIMAGNCAVIKPSEMAPECEKLLQLLIPKYLDQDCFSVVTGGIDCTSALLAQNWGKIFFTGSTRVGKIVMKAASEHLTPVSLELGGKSPTIIDDSVTDLDLVAQRVMWAKCANAGQTCIAPDYILCHEKHYDAFLAACVKCVKRFYGDDAQKSGDFARVISTAHCERLKSLIDSNPGTILHGGKVDVTDKYVEPTIITDVIMSSKVMSDEIFGPIMPVIKIKDMNEVINIVKTMDKPLSMYIFSKNSKNIDLLIKNIQSGGVLVNDTLFHFANAYIPFGGVGTSGLGGYHGKFSYECFSHRRSIMRRDDHMILDIPLRYPPYKENALIVFKFASKLPGIPSIPIIKSFFIKTIALGVFSVCIVYATNKFGWTIPIDL